MSKDMFSGVGNTEWLMRVLKENIIEVTFTKTNGEDRVMKCTLKEDIVPTYEKKTDRQKAKNDSVVSVWDVEKKEWRSFRHESVKAIQLDIL